MSLAKPEARKYKIQDGNLGLDNFCNSEFVCHGLLYDKNKNVLNS